ncbi:MAG TPA: alpha/beta fold hydrolase, partial [Streptosporangiaceae bacterium]
MPTRYRGITPARRPVTAAAALCCATALALAGCTSGSSSNATQPSPGDTSAAPTPAALHWRSCNLRGAPAQCASLQVPLDHRNPGGRKITLALSMVPATAPAAQRKGDMLVNPGGPGVGGLTLAPSVAYGLDRRVASKYNIIGFDPRGAGQSAPALHCDPSFFSGVRPDYVPANQREEQVLIARAKRYAAGCQRRFGWLLPFMTTQDTARDMDYIRAALGQQQISYFGYSYGTYLGEVYATLFPHRVRRMVLDSTVDPTGAWYKDNISQDYAFEGRIEAFFSWVAAHNSVYRLGISRAQVEQAWYRARAALESHPI